jgi:hypothetical protein
MPAALAWAVSAAWLYGPVLAKLIQDWRTDATYQAERSLRAGFYSSPPR